MIGPGRIALGWGTLAFAAALALSGAPGISEAEAATLSAGRRAAGSLVAASRQPAASARELAALSAERGRPLLAEIFHGFTGAGGERLGLGPIRGLRLGAALVAGLLAAALALGGFALGGVPVALLSPAVFWFTPRTVSLGLSATPDLLGALLWLVAVGAFARALSAATRLARTRAGLWCGCLCAAAAAVRPDLASLWLVLVAHWGLGRVHLGWMARRDRTAPEPSGDWSTRLRRVPTAIGTALLLIPVVALACWPSLWGAPLGGGGALLATLGWGQPAAVVNPALLALAALPATTVVLLALGVGHAALRLGAALRGDDGAVAWREALWLLAGLLPLLLVAVGFGPRSPGLAPLIHALPPLAMLSARAMVSLAELAWPARRWAVTGTLAIFLLHPGLRAAAVTYPHGASDWGEPLGGAPGAAWRGWPRQDGGEGARAVLPELARCAVPGARIRWVGAAPFAIQRYREAGLVRADLVDVATVAEADLVVVARGVARAEEYDAWTAFGTSRAVSAQFIDEVALVVVHARPGTWR